MALRYSPLSDSQVETFLNTLAATGNVAASCRAAKCERRDVVHRQKHDQNFAEAWDEAIEAFRDHLVAEAYDRAVNGVEEDVYYQGRVVGTKKFRSDSLLMFLIKKERPEYRDNLTLKQQTSINMSPDNVRVGTQKIDLSQLTAPELASLQKLLLKTVDPGSHLLLEGHAEEVEAIESPDLYDDTP